MWLCGTSGATVAPPVYPLKPLRVDLSCPAHRAPGAGSRASAHLTHPAPTPPGTIVPPTSWRSPGSPPNDRRPGPQPDGAATHPGPLVGGRGRSSRIPARTPAPRRGELGSRLVIAGLPTPLSPSSSLLQDYPPGGGWTTAGRGSLKGGGPRPARVVAANPVRRPTINGRSSTRVPRPRPYFFFFFHLPFPSLCWMGKGARTL